MTDKSLSFSLSLEIKASAEEIYRAFTNATALREWLCDVASTDPLPGGRIYFAWNSGNFAAGNFTKTVPVREIEFTTLSGNSLIHSPPAPSSPL